MARALWESESRAETYAAIGLVGAAALYGFYVYRREVKPQLSHG